MSTWRARIAFFGGTAAIAAMASLTACSPAPVPGEAQSGAGDWHEFQGSWNASGQRHLLGFGPGRRVALIDLTGSLLLSGPGRPGVGFRAEVVALVDTATGMAGRAVWTNENGDQAYSELRGEGTAAGNRIYGTFVGGTGRYAGANGTYEFSWQYVLEAEDGTVQGRSSGLKGRVRVGQPQVPPVAPGVKP